MIIAVEGIDGYGKDSVADALAQEIGAGRLNFPDRTTTVGNIIDEYLKGRWAVGRPATGRIDERIGGQELNAADGTDLNALALQSLMLVNRFEKLGRLRGHAYVGTDPHAPHLVVARYWQSGWVYGQLDGLDPDWLMQVHAPLLTLAPARVNLLLDVPQAVAYARRAARDGARPPERYEGDLAKLNLARELYMSLWTRRNNELWVVLDATHPLDVVISVALNVVNRVIHPV